MTSLDKVTKWKRRARDKQTKNPDAYTTKSIGPVDKVSPKLGSKRARRGGKRKYSWC